MSAFGLSGQAAIVIGTVGFFVVRNGYFAAFELTPRGATPGKRLLGLRVAARDGGRLTGMRSWRATWCGSWSCSCR